MEFDKHTAKYAYITFIIRNDGYVPGALTFAFSLRCQGTRHDLVCVVSENISVEAVDSLKILYDHVVVMDEISFKGSSGKKLDHMPFVFSRFNTIYIGAQMGYEKIVIADCDLLPIDYYDLLFLLDTPAGCINENKDNCVRSDLENEYIIPESFYQTGEWCWHDIYGGVCGHGSKIPKYITDRVLEDAGNMGVNTSLCLIKPDAELYESIMDDLQNEETRQLIEKFHWPEMQYLTVKFSGEWHNIDLRYSAFNGYPELSGLFGIHYSGLKPWQNKNKSILIYGRHEDFKLWYAVYVSMMQKYPKLYKNGKLAKLSEWINNLYEDGRYVFRNKYLNNVAKFF